MLEFNYDDSVLLNLIRTEDGKLLPDWSDMRVSQRWREPVQWLPRRVAGVPDKELEQITGLYRRLDRTDSATYDALLTVLSDLVRRCIDDLVSQPYDILFPPLPPR